jgi:hypothetical protein
MAISGYVPGLIRCIGNRSSGISAQLCGCSGFKTIGFSLMFQSGRMRVQEEKNPLDPLHQNQKAIIIRNDQHEKHESLFSRTSMSRFQSQSVSVSNQGTSEAA